jgi:hypothetical protein
MQSMGSGGLMRLVCALALVLYGSAVGAEPQFELPADLGTPVIRYLERIDGIRHPDPGARLEVYADGMVVLHRPPYMRDAGDWEMHLDPVAVRALVRELLDDGVAEFDAHAQRAAIRAAPRGAQPEVFHTDESVVEIELRLDGYRSATGAGPMLVLQHTARWRGLRTDVRNYPERAALRGLAAARARLEAIKAHPGYWRRSR